MPLLKQSDQDEKQAHLFALGVVLDQAAALASGTSRAEHGQRKRRRAQFSDGTAEIARKRSIRCIAREARDVGGGGTGHAGCGRALAGLQRR